MKRITSIIRIHMMNQTKQALIAQGFSAFTVHKVLGRGKGEVDFRVLSAAATGQPEAISHLKDGGPMLVPKRLITIVVPAAKADAVVQTIIKVNQTGKPGDGKVFVQPVSETFRIRTGERNQLALKE
jgi:nitrogen regulatory protein PII 2